MVAAALLVTEAVGETSALAMPAPAYGVVATGALVVLLLVAWAFRSVGTRH